MTAEFRGIERRLDELSERLSRLEPLKSKARVEFEEDAYLRDIVERNLEIAAQSCIDICHRLIAVEKARKPADYYESFLILGELGVLPVEFAQRMAPLAGFRNVLVHEYLGVDWDIVYQHLQRLDELYRFGEYVRGWLNREA